MQDCASSFVNGVMNPDHDRMRALVLAAILTAGCAGGAEPSTTPQTLKEALVAACSAIDAPSLRGLDHAAHSTKLAEEITRRATNAEFQTLFASLGGMEPAQKQTALAAVLARNGLTECKSFGISAAAVTRPSAPSLTARATDPAFALTEQGGKFVGRVDLACPAGAVGLDRADLRKGFRLAGGQLEVELPYGGCPTWAGYTVVHGTGAPLPFQVCYERAHDMCEVAGNRTWVFDVSAPLAASRAADVVYADLTRAP